MTDQEKDTLYGVILQLIDDGKVLTNLERRDLLNQLMVARCGMTADEILLATKNNRKLRVKRGTTAQNDEYTGPAGEITMDTDENTLRIHDGATPGGHTVAGGGAALPENIDYVVEWQVPTAENNYTWYRKYASGWVEQGGVVMVNKSGVMVTMPITMGNLKYYVNVNSIGEADGDAVSRTTKIVAVNQIQIRIGYNSNLNRECSWEVKGVATSALE